MKCAWGLVSDRLDLSPPCILATWAILGKALGACKLRLRFKNGDSTTYLTSLPRECIVCLPRAAHSRHLARVFRFLRHRLKFPGAAVSFLAPSSFQVRSAASSLKGPRSQHPEVGHLMQPCKGCVT